MLVQQIEMYLLLQQLSISFLLIFNIPSFSSNNYNFALYTVDNAINFSFVPLTL
jgi:hypothetical protein